MDEHLSRAGGVRAAWIGLTDVSPRRTRRPAPAAAPVPVTERTETWADGEWVVRTVSGAATTKAYRCPGCDQEIVPGTPHVVAWPADWVTGPGQGVEQRRHWHTACWQHRLKRKR
jgi:hypothetical protein